MWAAVLEGVYEVDDAFLVVRIVLGQGLKDLDFIDGCFSVVRGAFDDFKSDDSVGVFSESQYR